MSRKHEPTLTAHNSPRISPGMSALIVLLFVGLHLPHLV